MSVYKLIPRLADQEKKLIILFSTSIIKIISIGITVVNKILTYFAAAYLYPTLADSGANGGIPPLIKKKNGKCESGRYFCPIFRRMTRRKLE